MSRWTYIKNIKNTFFCKIFCANIVHPATFTEKVNSTQGHLWRYISKSAECVIWFIFNNKEFVAHLFLFLGTTFSESQLLYYYLFSNHTRIVLCCYLLLSPLVERKHVGLRFNLVYESKIYLFICERIPCLSFIGGITLVIRIKSLKERSKILPKACSWTTAFQ